MARQLSMSQTKPPSASCHLLLSLFRRQVKSPSITYRAAVIDDCTGTQLNFLELDDQSQRVASNLRQMIGTGSEQSVIGVLMPPSAERVVAFVGILKLCAVFLPLDETLPTLRLKHIFEHSKIKNAICTSTFHHYREFRELCDAVGVSCIDYEDLLKHVEATELDQVLEGNPVASLLYTSGSTGQPKPVKLHSSNWMAVLESFWKSFPPSEGDVWCHKAPIGFVDGMFEIIVSLLSGTTLVVMKKDDVSNPMRFLEKISLHNITHLIMVPSLARAIATVVDNDQSQRQKLSSVRAFICSGEVLKPSLALHLRTILPEKCVLVNYYGSTETTGGASQEIFHDIEDIVAKTYDHSLSVGSPIVGTTIHILDSEGQPVHPGQKGAIYVGGHNVANDCCDKDLYNTGDGGFIHEGCLFVTERLDNVVKIRGQKVSCAEVENVISKVTGVGQVKVLPVKKPDSNSVKLVAFCTEDAKTAKENVLTWDEPTAFMLSVAESCKAVLPLFMVPKVVIVKELPVSPGSGKVDCEALLDLYRESQGKESDGRSGTDDNNQILSLLARELDMPSTFLLQNENKCLTEFGGDSLAVVNILSSLLSKGYKCSLDTLLSSSIAQLVNVDSDTEYAGRQGIERSSEKLEDISERFRIQLLRSIDQHESIKKLVASEYCNREPLDIIKDIPLQEIEKVVELIWPHIEASNMSFVMQDVQHSNKVVGASININASIIQEVQYGSIFRDIQHIIKVASAPVRDYLQDELGEWLDSTLIAIDSSLPTVIQLKLLREMEKFLISLAIKKGVKGIIATDSNPMTKLVAEELGYIVKSSVHVKSFKNGDTQPFLTADNDYFVYCLTKQLH